jgi:hypothetical protein
MARGFNQILCEEVKIADLSVTQARFALKTPGVFSNPQETPPASFPNALI